tara:strand:- start:931 stop:1374 length:444 start_codon:yes stop_codon:yes gene_type:complete
MKRSTNNLTAAFIFIVASVGWHPSFANEDALEYRHDVFESSEYHIKAAFAIFLGKVPHSEHLVLHANALADFGNMISALFPEGSEGGEALPAVWEEPELFASRLEEYRQAAAAFKLAASEDNKASIQTALPALGQACKNCHDKFREE